MTEREALKLALVALGEIEWSNDSKWQSDRAKVAITSIKEALAQPEQEPFGYFRYDLRLDAWVQNRAGITGTPFYTTPPQRKPLTDESIKIMREMLEVQGQHGNWNYDSYMHGLYNGMEYMVALAEKREPQFRDVPETWLAKFEVKRNNFNNTEPIEAAHGIKGEA